MAPPGRSVSDLEQVVPGAVLSDPRGDDPLVVDVTHDSRRAGEGVLFVALRGERHDGHDFVKSAIASGSPAVCVEAPQGSDIVQLIVPDTRSAVGHLASVVHDNPSQGMTVVGVTGTNGKTTVTHYVESMARSIGLSTGLIGTIVTRIGDEGVDSSFTTPEAADFQRLLAAMRDGGTELVAVEVSSHALELGRVAATEFAVAAFTNLSQDHLDFHGDMDSYRASKWRLFGEYAVGHAVFNIDDETGRDFAERYEGKKTTIGTGGEVSIRSLRVQDTTTAFELATPWGQRKVLAPIVGRFNVENAVLAATCLLVAGYGLDSVTTALETISGVPGRYEIVSGHDPIRVVVDYAHTPAGITEALDAARQLEPHRVIAVVGAGGDRDRAKRPMMGAAVSSADIAFITTDNPRSEDPSAIAAAVAAGVDLRTDTRVELDRRTAIEEAIEEADDGDVVLILGRGHEPMQDTGGVLTPFDDRQVATEVLGSMRKSADSEHDSGSMQT